ncbi:MAG: DUF3575 domain-containing protein [Bacteroidales bacterium]|nr:DUF3575 domain-containing protein [Bacteroidales bacterium]
MALKAVLALAFILAPSLFLRAQERTLRVYYPYDDATLMRNYMNNAEIFAQFEELLADGDVPSFEIVSYSSPEGDWNYNLRLSRRRAKSLKVYLERKYPQLIGHITINPSAESWEELHRLVSSDSRLSESHRAEILQIVDSDKAPDVKERELKRMEGYRMFYKHFFRGLRYAQISVVDETPESSKVADSGTDGVVTADEIVVTDTTTVISAVSENVEDSVNTTETAEPASNNSSAVSGSAVTASVSTPSEAREDNEVSGEGTITSVAGVPVVYFLYNEDFIRPDFKNNAANLQEIVRLIKAGEITDFTIAGFSSPEGSIKVNESLSYRRAMAFRNYLVNLLPELEGRITIVNGGENWNGLREQVENGTALTEGEKEEILGIIDSNDDPQAKEIRLTRTTAYRKMGHSYFPNIRRASFVRNAGQPAGTTTEPADTEPAGTEPQVDTPTTTDKSDDSAVVYYVNNDDQIRPSYMDNEDNMVEIRRILSNPAGVRRIVVVGTASPEGPEKYNEELAQRRAESFVKMLLDLCPELEGKIEIKNAGENWDGLRRAVLASRRLTRRQKDEVVRIIDSNNSPRRKEQLLTSSSAWRIIRDEILPKMRCAGISGIEFEPVDDSPASPQDLQPVVDTLATQIDTTDIQIDTTFTQIDTTFTPIDTLERKPEVKPRYPVVAVSTNLALDAIIAPNFAIEVPLNKKWSAYAEYTFPWWLSKNNDWCYEMLKWDFGMRYRISNDFDWEDPMDILKGHFVGVDLSAGYYDFEPRHNGYQGEFQMATLEYGYAWDLGNNWRLDAVLGAGWMGTHYRYYEADATDKHLIYQHSAKMNWFGPTKLGVSVKYIFTTSKERKR